MSALGHAGARRSGFRLFSSLFSVVFIVALGYLTFLFFVTEFRPTVGFSSLILFAVVAGVATFFSPCSFPLIPGYLSYYLTASGEDGRQGRAFYYGVVAALGVVTFNLILGAMIGGLGEAFAKSFSISSSDPNPYVRFLRGAVGAFLLTLGFVHLSERSLGFHFLSELVSRIFPARTDNPIKGLYLYGFGYNAVGIGCAGPILAGLSAFAFSWGGFAAAILAFLVFSITMVALMVFISLLSGTARYGIINRIARSTPAIVKIGGGIQALLGIFLIYSSIYVDVFVKLLFPSP